MRIVDRLERAGYARRERHPTDRRSVVVHPLELAELKERIGPVFASLGRMMQGITGRYNKKELAVIADYLDRTTAVLRNETAKLFEGSHR
jgi:DNA-binding MarR family transcriptional regulator